MRSWVVIAVALVGGFLLRSADLRTDDTGIEATLLLGSALVLTLLVPRAAFAIALALGLPIVLLNGGLPALLFSGLGAAIGYGLRRVAATRPG